MSEYYSINFEGFNIDIGISLSDLGPDRSKKDLIKDEVRNDIKNYYFDIVRELHYEEAIEDMYGVDLENDEWDDIISKVWVKDKPIYTAVSIKKLPTCEGCRLETSRQRDHMSEGGCLYEPYDHDCTYFC